MATVVRAAEPAPVTAAAVSNCLEHLRGVIAGLEARLAGVSNETVEASCLAEKLTKASSLSELASNLNETLERRLGELDAEDVKNNRVLILSACTRIDKIAEDAERCGDSVKPRKRRPLASTALTNTPRPHVDSSKLLPASAIRDETTCLKQAKFAWLLMAVMNIGGGQGGAATRELAKRGIEPLGGWSGDACVTVDSFCVIVARALQLEVADVDDPYSYVEACRDHGLPVDALLPRRGRDSVPRVVLEAEARRFLAQGYSLRPASSRRIQP